MKKLFSLVLIVISMGFLAACNEVLPEDDNGNGNGNGNNETTEPEETFMLSYGVDAFYIEEEVTIDEDKSLLEHLQATYTVTYDETDFGTMITGIGDLATSAGNYVQIIKNDESSMVGIDDLTFEENDHIHFELTWWDYQAQANHIVDTFVEYHLDEYVTSKNMYVLSALHHLDMADSYAFEIPELDDSFTTGQLLSYLIIGEVKDVDVSEYENALKSTATTDFLYTAALISLILDDPAFDQLFIDKVEVTELTELDLDTLSLVSLALNKLNNDTYDTIIIETLETELYESAYGDNAATFSHVIMALTALGEDITDARYNQGDDSLLKVFLSYYHAEGAFYYQLDSETPDLAFTTPQAFLALVLLTEDATHPFIFE